jgi:hypothetical protein
MCFVYFNFIAEKVDKMENDELDDGEVDDDDEEEMSDELKIPQERKESCNARCNNIRN